MPTLERPLRSLRILVVEDEPRMRELLLDVLPDMGGGEVSAVRSAEEAFHKLAQESFDLLMLDLQLPQLSGMELLERVRQQSTWVDVILVSAFGDFTTAQRAIDLSVAGFVSKPFHLNDLEESVQRVRRRLPVPQVSVDVRQLPPPTTLADLEIQQISAALTRHSGNRTAAAAELGMSRRTLHYRLSEYRRRGILLPIHVDDGDLPMLPK